MVWKQPPRLACKGEAPRNTVASKKGYFDGSPYFKVNNAFTCAVTVTVCGVNSSVGAGGVALAMAAMG